MASKSNNERALSMRSILTQIRDENLWLKDSPELKEMIRQFITERCVGGLVKSIKSVMQLVGKKTVGPKELELALQAISPINQN